MDCGECEHEKSVHLTKIVNGKAESLHVCADCPKLNLGAELAPAPAAGSSAKFSLQAFLAGIKPAKPRSATPTKPVMACEACGLTFDEFRQTGRLGCHHDYEAFRGGLERLLRKIHGATQHVGRVPERIGERMAKREAEGLLQAQLADAIAKEDYERAATLRDRIREL